MLGVHARKNIVGKSEEQQSDYLSLIDLVAGRSEWWTAKEHAHVGESFLIDTANHWYERTVVAVGPIIRGESS